MVPACTLVPRAWPRWCEIFGHDMGNHPLMINPTALVAALPPASALASGPRSPGYGTPPTVPAARGRVVHSAAGCPQATVHQPVLSVPSGSVETGGRRPLRAGARLTDGLLGIERDELVAHDITHPDAATCFDAHSHSGPLRPWADEQGPEVVARVRTEFVRRAPAGEWTHRPSARHIVMVRDRESP